MATALLCPEYKKPKGQQFDLEHLEICRASKLTGALRELTVQGVGLRHGHQRLILGGVIGFRV